MKESTPKQTWLTIDGSKRVEATTRSNRISHSSRLRKHLYNRAQRILATIAGVINICSGSCTKKELSCNNCKKKGHLAHMCKGDKTVAEQQSTSTDGAPKKVTFPKGTKKESATVMTAEIIDVDTSEASEVVSAEWLADSGASWHICHDKRILWDLRELEIPVIVRQMVGQVPVTYCGTVRVECENEVG